VIKVSFLMHAGLRPGWYIVQRTAEGLMLWSPERFDDPWLAALELEKKEPEIAEKLLREQLEAACSCEGHKN
jgi:hypothetical protein